jgi:SurA N-terminal domain/PPIC-type PPIASE domain
MRNKKTKSKSKTKDKKSRKLPFSNRLKSKPTEEKISDALSDVPNITDQTLSEHREEVLGSARKYIYPLKHSRHHFVRISIGLLLGVLIAFFVYCGLELYDFQSTSGFMYSVTEVVPFPVAKAGTSWVSYYSYLFELRRNIHYYQTQQQADFSTPDGKAQLLTLKKQAMAQVTEDAYVKQLAKKNHVNVSSAEVNEEVTLVRDQNRLGNNNAVFDNVLKEYWGWTEGDFKQELSQQLLQQKVVATLDTATDARANTVYRQLLSGANFATEAQQYSDDASTKANGGQYSQAISQDSASLAPQVTAELFRLTAGQTSPIINTGYTLEILKVNSVAGNTVQASHIQFNFQPISVYTNPLRAKNSPKQYIKF